MPRAAPVWNVFNGGEFSPFMDGRTDQEKYYTGCKTLQNFVPTAPGPAVRRGGTRFVAEVKASAKRTWMARFEFSQDQAYVLEFGDLYIRFFTGRGQLLSGASPYEIASPYALADLTTADGTFALQMTQSGDILYIVHSDGKYQQRTLKRLAATNWVLSVFEPEGGPFNDTNPSAGVTVYASAVTGTGITLTASAATFQAGHVGRLFYLEPINPSVGIAPWKTGDPNLTVGTFRRNAGNYYEAKTAGTTGAGPPIHERGTATDGGVSWEYLHSGYGWVRITAVASGTSATADVVSRLPAEVVGVANATTYWAHQSLSSVEGWPTAVAFFRERLTFAKGFTLYTSRAGSFSDFSRRTGPDVTPDAAMILDIASDRVDQVRWLTPLKRGLAVGTAGGEIAVAEATDTAIFSPQNVTAIPQTDYGSRRMPALRVGNVALFLQRSGRKLREYRYTYEEDQFLAPDLTVLSDHISQSGIIDYTWQQEPDSIVWCARSDGVLVGLTYNRDRGVVGWHRHTIGGSGIVEAVESIPSPGGDGDDLWLIIRRTINGATKRYVEYLERPLADGANQKDAFYVDSGLTYNGAPATVISGLSHLEAATVTILADGATHPDKTVSGGSVTLDRSASIVHIGYGFTSRLQTMRPEAGGGNGTAQGKLKRVHKIVLRLLRTLGGKYGPSFSSLSEILFRTGSDLMDAPPPLFTGDKELPFGSDWDRDGYVCIEQTQPLPMTIVAIMPHMVTNDG